MSISNRLFFVGIIGLFLIFSFNLVSAQVPSTTFNFPFGVTQCGPTCGPAVAATLVHHFNVTTDNLAQIYAQALIFSREIAGNNPRRGLTTQQTLNVVYKLFEHYNLTGGNTGGLTATGHGGVANPAGLPTPIPGGGTTWTGEGGWNGGNPSGGGIGGCPNFGTGTLTVFQLGRSGGGSIGHFIIVLANLGSALEIRHLAPPYTALGPAVGTVYSVLYYDPETGTAQPGEIFEWTVLGRNGLDFKTQNGKNINIGRGGFSISR